MTPLVTIGIPASNSKRWTRPAIESALARAQTDLAEAAPCQRERQREGLIHLAGPTAPLPGRFLRRWRGFSFAEFLARVLR